MESVDRSDESSVTENDLRVRYGYKPKKRKTLKKNIKNAVQCNVPCMKNKLFNLIPILTWLPKYPFMEYALGDLISGITTAIVRIPQGLAYGLLAGLLPINGLYTGFFSPLVYTIFGTSRHISVGVFSVISLMLGNALDNLEIDASVYFDDNSLSSRATSNNTILSHSNISDANSTSPNVENIGRYTNAQNLTIILSLTVLIGLILLILGICRLGIVAMFLSDPVVSGFTTAAAIYVVTAQMKYITGIPLQRKSGIFGLISTYIDLFSRISEIQWSAIITSAICLLILVPIKYVNRNYSEKLKNIPIPGELMIVILGTGISYGAKLSETYSIKIIGSVPKGMPSPMLPNISLWPVLIGDAISIAIVTFAVAVSMGKLFAKKHGYNIDPNQELIALGLCQITSGSFQGHSGGGALARSVVQESSGGNTQVAALVSCSVMLLVLLVIGPVFKSLPVACLACIILANLHSLLLQFNKLPRLWKVDKYDFSVWLMTFIFVIILGVDLGLYAGVIFSLCCGGLRQSGAKVKFLGGLEGTDIYRDIEYYQNVHEVPGIKIIEFTQSPTYANKSSLQKITPTYFEHEVNISPTDKSLLSKSNDDIENCDIQQQILTKNVTTKIKYIIFDCSHWNMIDTVGMSTLLQVITDLKLAEKEVFLTSVCEDVHMKLSLYGIVDDEKSAVKVFPTVSLAVAAAKLMLEMESNAEPESRYSFI
uniref:prestin-like n=1 Tax=Styela clava TaxID=7725 RepID=UPI00193A1957|nr:prestin-like [Styela clava]